LSTSTVCYQFNPITAKTRWILSRKKTVLFNITSGDS